MYGICVRHSNTMTTTVSLSHQCFVCHQLRLRDHKPVVVLQRCHMQRCQSPSVTNTTMSSRCTVTVSNKHYDVKPLHSHLVKQTLRCQAAAQSPCQLETLLGSAPLDISTVIASLCLDYISWYLCSALVCDDVTSAGTPLLIGVLLLNGGIGASSVPF